MNKPEHLTPNQDFDWEAYEQGTTALHEDRQADLEKYEATLANVKEKEVVKGRIARVRQVAPPDGYGDVGETYAEACSERHVGVLAMLIL